MRVSLSSNGVLCGRITRLTQDIGETVWSGSRDRLDLMIKRTQIVVVDWSRVGDVKIEHITSREFRYRQKHVIGIAFAASTSSSWCTQEKPDETKYLSKCGSGGAPGTTLWTVRYPYR
jgi:hypothetical protein